MTDPITRATEALKAALSDAVDLQSGLHPDDLRKGVRAVLMAIREPSDAMIKAGEAWRDHCSDVDSLFREMIKIAIYGPE